MRYVQKLMRQNKNKLQKRKKEVGLQRPPTQHCDKMLSKVAEFYEDEVSAMGKALTSMLEPAMIVVVGGIVGSILLAMYLPMFSLFDQIQ